MHRVASHDHGDQSFEGEGNEHHRSVGPITSTQRNRGDMVMRLQTLPSAWGITLIRVMAGLIILVAGLEKWGAGGLTGFTQALTNVGLPLAAFWGVWIPLQEV